MSLRIDVDTVGPGIDREKEFTPCEKGGDRFKIDMERQWLRF